MNLIDVTNWPLLLLFGFLMFLFAYVFVETRRLKEGTSKDREEYLAGMINIILPIAVVIALIGSVITFTIDTLKSVWAKRPNKN